VRQLSGLAAIPPRPAIGQGSEDSFMRVAAGLIIAVSLGMPGVAWSQSAPSRTAAAPQAAAPQSAPAALPAAAPARPACANPNALGIGRTVEIDTTGGPGFGFEHFKELDFLRDHEVVLTFDDGPWPENTPSVLKTLAEECTTAIFFPIAFSAALAFVAPEVDGGGANQVVPFLGRGAPAPLWMSLALADFSVKFAIAVFALAPFRAALGWYAQRT
jgi:hypothetical protein